VAGSSQEQKHIARSVRVVAKARTGRSFRAPVGQRSPAHCGRKSYAALQDSLVSPLGAKGAGEIGITGAAAIGNAVYHATGKRVRELPITLDKLL
jgi:hypothetical protein